MEQKIRVVKGTPKHLSKTGKLNSFTYLMINLPFECNFRCTKCFNLNENFPENYSKNISIDERLNLLIEAKELGAKVVVIAGEGEPSLNKDIKKIVSEINSLEMIPVVYSNGSTLNREFIDFYKKKNATIVISFDSLKPAKYNFLTGTTSQFEKTVNNIKNAINEFSETIEFRENLEIFRIAINTTVSSLNENEIGEIKKFFGKKAYFICNPLAKLGNAVKNWNNMIYENIDLKKQEEIIKKLSEAGGPLTLGNDGLCGYSAWGIAVNPAGDYMTCAYTNRTNGLLGSIRTKSLKDAFELKHKIESQHYKEHGIVPCLVRAKSFENYLAKLKETKK